MTLSKELWEANQDLAQASLELPFVRGIGDGTLPRELFTYYMGQDALFLKAYARAFSVAAAKAPDWEGVQAFHDQANGPINELRLHEKEARDAGVELQDAEPGPATRRYTDFLLATAWGHDAGLTAVATLPCGRLYACLGHELARDGFPDHAYGDWIRTYGGPEMEESAGQLEYLVDRYASDTPLVRSTYRYAMFCEREFFQAAWEYEASGKV